MASPSIHVVVLSWPGQADNARHIADQARSVAEHVTVIHSCPDDQRLPARPDWLQIPDHEFYGPKFARSLALNRGDVLMQLHADARAPDWAHVVRRCREAHDRIPNLGVWAPDVDYTPFPLEEVHIGALGGGELVPVAQTDSIAWSLSAPVIDRMRQLDLRATPLGWGLDWAAISFCVSHGLLVVRDRTLRLAHPRGSGYGRANAERQMFEFMRQLSPAEHVAHALLIGHIEQRRQALGRPLTGI